MKSPIRLVVAIAIALTVHSLKLCAQDKQTNRIWKTVSESQLKRSGERHTIPSKFRSLQINNDEMKQLLSRAPMESFSNSRLTDGLIFFMPMPDGTFQRFKIFEYYVMHPNMAAKYPDIKTYTGQGIDNPAATIKISMTRLGFYATVHSVTGDVTVAPYCKNNTIDYMSYNLKDLTDASSFACGSEPDTKVLKQTVTNNAGFRTTGSGLKLYHLAVACTGEYCDYHKVTAASAKADAASAVVITINELNLIYEREVAIRFQLAPNSDTLIFSNPGSDPYPTANNNDDLGRLNYYNQIVCDSLIGSANYDIGHVFTCAATGGQSPGKACRNDKAMGASGYSDPHGSIFTGLVAHEMGHQFRASHTFSTQNCPYGLGPDSFEPGSGTTIMTYAGTCDSADIIPHRMHYFHAASINRIVEFTTTGTGSTCKTNIATSNTPPLVTSMGLSYTIPVSTPFVLTGEATDADGDPLTYSWEGYDQASTNSLLDCAPSKNPLFRSFEPVSSPSRTFPRLTDVILNIMTPGELLPCAARTMKFKLTVRDNKGGVMHPDTTLKIQVVNNGGPFTVAYPNTNVQWNAGTKQIVAWNVNGTNLAPINTASVKISLSTDGGYTFPYLLLVSTPNDGADSIVVPNFLSNITAARIKVEAVGNIFFDMSNQNFTINKNNDVPHMLPLTGPYCAGSPLNVTVVNNGASGLFNVMLSDASGTFAPGTLIGTAASGNGSFTITSIIPPNITTGNGYRIRVVRSSPYLIGNDNGYDLFISGSLNNTLTITGPATACNGGAAIYVANTLNNATTYNWAVTTGSTISSSADPASVRVTFGTTATAKIFVTASNGCFSASSDITVTLNNSALPTLFSVTGGGPYCQGGSGSLIGLSDTDSGTSYQLMFDRTNPVLSPFNGNGNQLPLALRTVAGTYTVIATSSNNCKRLMSDSAVVSITPLPIVTTSDVSVCYGKNINFSASPSGGSWNISGIAYTGPDTTFIYTYTDPVTGCANSASADILVNPNPVPVITGPAFLCPGSTDELKSSQLYDEFLWSTGSIIGSTNINAAGTYILTVTDEAGCTGITTKNVADLTPVISGNASFCTGGSVTLTASSGFNTYQWKQNGNNITGATSQSFNAIAGGNYSVTVTHSSGCTATSYALNVSANTNPTLSLTGNNYFCTGSSTTLTATSGLSSYQWKRDGITLSSTTNTVSANIAGKYSVTVTNASGCTAKDSVIVFSITNPSPTISGNTSFCTGGSAALTATSGYSSYQWKKNISAIPGATSQIYTATDSGTYSVTVVNTNGCTGSASKTITVNANPTVTINGNTYFCSGGSTTLTATAGYTSYQWKRDATTLSSVTNTISANIHGSYIVTVTNNNGCTGTASKNVMASNVTASVTPSGLTMCEGNTGSITANSGTNFTYQWRKNGGNIANATNAILTASQSGSYSVIVTQGGVCSATSGNSTANFLTNPIPSITPSTSQTICQGNNITLTSGTVTGATYKWYRNPYLISGATNSSYVVSSTGQYFASRTHSNGCSRSSISVQVNVNSCRFADATDEIGEIQETATILITPNPFSEGAVVTIPENVDLKNASIDIYNILGEKVKSVAADKSQFILTTEKLKPGVYLLRLNTDHGPTETTRFIVQ